MEACGAGKPGCGTGGLLCLPWARPLPWGPAVALGRPWTPGIPVVWSNQWLGDPRAPPIPTRYQLPSRRATGQGPLSRWREVAGFKAGRAEEGAALLTRDSARSPGEEKGKLLKTSFSGRELLWEAPQVPSPAAQEPCRVRRDRGLRRRSWGGRGRAEDGGIVETRGSSLALSAPTLGVSSLLRATPQSETCTFLFESLSTLTSVHGPAVPESEVRARLEPGPAHHCPWTLAGVRKAGRKCKCTM